MASSSPAGHDATLARSSPALPTAGGDRRDRRGRDRGAGADRCCATRPIPIARAWNTWSSRPAEMVFLPLGVRLTPVLYANSSRCGDICSRPEPGVRLGRHAVDAQHRRAGADACRHDAGLVATASPIPSSSWGAGMRRSLANGACASGSTFACRPRKGTRCASTARPAPPIVKVGHRFVALASAERAGPGDRARLDRGPCRRIREATAISISARAPRRRRCWRCASTSK